ncbi:MAG: hypothetical protein DDT32_01855 [Syntrophomonadaceae bacterium]|nr:hypothetical protein [Bacillota bacterium]
MTPALMLLRVISPPVILFSITMRRTQERCKVWGVTSGRAGAMVCKPVSLYPLGLVHDGVPQGDVARLEGDV